ncbi:MAG: Zn-ribbon domain-containing OB-fold protein [Deltaproteobacteria bacterium]|nr:Zn-ribbon domain-containing OB-fold protein [Deltaproteobacteria bacterium]
MAKIFNKAKKAPRYNPAAKLEEVMTGTTVFNVPFPKDLDALKDMSPIVIKHPYYVEYLHSYGQDSPFFAGLANRKILGTRCPKCDYTYATPRMHCTHCGEETNWVEIPQEGRVHTFTTCYFGSEEFLKETPFHLVLVEFDGVDTLLLARLIGVDGPEDIRIGMKIRAKFRRNSQLKPTDVYFVPVA